MEMEPTTHTTHTTATTMAKTPKKPTTTTTQILFNSPALHALKRDQLVKLCKIHSIKASGKSADLVEKLQRHAETLPQTRVSYTDHAELHEDDSDEEDGSFVADSQRSSEQWEMMDSIEELDEFSSNGTMSSLKTMGSSTSPGNEFGFGGGKATSVNVSIKALASNLKRNISVKSSHSARSAMSIFSQKPDELAQTSVPYSAIPPTNPANLPQEDHFKFSTPDGTLSLGTSHPASLLGQADRLGVPAPENAKLATAPKMTVRPSAGPTTIRLVTAPSRYAGEYAGHTPVLKAWKTNFELVTDEDDGANPASPTPRKIYPVLPSAKNVWSDSTVGQKDHSDTGGDETDENQMPGALSRSPPPKLTFTEPELSHSQRSPTLCARSPIPPAFIFGSPLAAPSTPFTFRSATASVLEEMNKRLGIKGVESVGTEVLDRLKVQTTSDGGLPARPPARTALGEKEKFDKLHQQEFDKMGSIADHYAVRGRKRKSVVADEDATTTTEPRKMVARKIALPVGARKPLCVTTTIHRGAGAREKVGKPVALHKDSEGDTRMSKRPRVVKETELQISAQDEQGADAREALEQEKHGRVSIAPTADKEERIRKEHETIRRKLDLSKARRRSSMGRVSVGGGKPPLIPNRVKPTLTSRFGFLSSAKSMMQTVFKGVGSGKSVITNAKSAMEKPRSSKTCLPPRPANTKKPVPTTSLPTKTSTVLNKQGGGLAPSDSARKFARPSTAPSAGTRPDSVASSRRTATGKVIGAASGQNRVNSNSKGSVSTTGSKVTSGRVASSSGSRTTSLSASASSSSSMMSMGLGTRSSSRVSSMGSRSSLISDIESAKRNVKVEPGKRPLSRLMAPTASSLARAQSATSTMTSTSQVSIVARQSKAEATLPQSETPPPVLGQITNSPAMGISQTQSTVDLTSPPGAAKKKPAVLAPRSFLDEDPQSLSTVPAKKQLIAVRKPRISRSKVIAKLASQRSVKGPATSVPVVGFAGAGSSRTRSSMGNAVMGAGVGGRGSAGAAGAVVMSAKKRVRQSEYARRRSRVGVVGAGQDMDVGDD